MPESPKEFLEHTVAELISKMGFAAEVTVIEEGGAEAPLYLCRAQVAADQNFLIGQHGINLAALQHITRAAARKRLGEALNVVVDVNDYFAEKRRGIEQEAEKAAREAADARISVSLRPMLPYERKIVHSYLANRSDVLTESVGQGGERKIMVRPRISAEEAPAL